MNRKDWPWLAVVPDPTWLVECSDNQATGGAWVLTIAPQKTGICATCGKSIFGNKEHRA